jgi:hypothetical protein
MVSSKKRGFYPPFFLLLFLCTLPTITAVFVTYAIVTTFAAYTLAITVFATSLAGTIITVTVICNWTTMHQTYNSYHCNNTAKECSKK